MLAQRLLWLRRLGALCLAMTFVLMVLGAWVKATGSGLSCPDWPTCYGEWLPPFPSQETGGIDPANADHADAYTQAQVLYEWTHRAVASLLGVPILALALLAVTGRELSRPMRVLPAALVAMLAVQVLLGKLTVNIGNEAWATTLHLAAATLIVILVTAVAAVAYLAPLAPAKPEAAPAPKPRVVSYVYRDESAPQAGSETEARDG
ncbi:MAG: COX15/CtaA family protein [Candidatus Thermoplasmatota archaeon]|jgi:cytochrome c oxidase assembly protein subunit 15